MKQVRPQTTIPQVHLAVSTMGSCAQDFAEGPLAQQNLDAGANMLIPVPSPLGGVIVIGESVIAYFAEGQAMKVTPIKQTIIRVRTPLHGHLSITRRSCCGVAMG